MYLISIIIPAYNVQSTIIDCINSVLFQLKSNYELIVVNDGSTDDTLSLLELIQKEHGYNNFSIINQTNQGVAEARNQGLKIAIGNYILWLDADDILLPNALTLLEKSIQEKQPDVIVFDFMMWFPEKNHKRVYINHSYQKNILIKDKDIILNTFFIDRLMYPWERMFKLDIYKKQSIPVFPPNKLFEDISTVPKLLFNCENLLYLPHAMIDYRQHSTSITKTISEKSCLDFASALLPVKYYFEQQKISESTKLYFDATVCYLYLSAIKDSFQLPRLIAKKIREDVKYIFINSLFNDYQEFITLLEQGKLYSHNSKFDSINAKNIKLSLSKNRIFFIKRTLSAKIKIWRKTCKKLIFKFRS